MPDLGFSRPDKDFRAESDLRTLLEAKKIESNKDRMNGAMKMAKKKRDELKSLEV